MSVRAKKIFWQAFWLANWLIILGFWLKGSSSLLNQGTASFILALGRLFGLSAAYMILVQFFLMGRNPWLERLFGLDKLSKVHHTNGKYGLLFLLVHPALLTYAYASFAKVSLLGQFKSFLFEYKVVDLAAIGAALFISVVIVSLVIIRKRLRYETWYFVHLLAYLAVFSSFWHQIALGEDIIGQKLFYGYWIGLYVAVFASHLVFRFIRPIYNHFRHGFFVQNVVRETYNTVSVYIGGKDLDKFDIQPGQFMILRFLAKNFWWQAHPFSLSAVPEGRHLRVTIKEVGDFTKAVAGIKPGTKIIIDGPYGVFTQLFAISPKILFIAGGIGITPIRSLSEQLAKLKKDVVLLYSNHTEKDIIFKHELSSLRNAKIIHVITGEPSYPGEKGLSMSFETGRLNEEKIKRLVPDFASRDIFLCGPVGMMDALIEMLKALGVPPKCLHFEKFSLQ